MDQLIKQLEEALNTQIKDKEERLKEYKEQIDLIENEIKVLNGRKHQYNAKMDVEGDKKKELEKQLKIIEKRF